MLFSVLKERGSKIDVKGVKIPKSKVLRVKQFCFLEKLGEIPLFLLAICDQVVSSLKPQAGPDTSLVV